MVTAAIVLLLVALPASAGARRQLLFSTYDGPFGESNGQGKVFSSDLQGDGTILTNIQQWGVVDPEDQSQNIQFFSATGNGLFVVDNDGGGDNGSILFYDTLDPFGQTTTVIGGLNGLTDVVYDPINNLLYYTESANGTVGIYGFGDSVPQTFIGGLDNPVALEIDLVNRDLFVGQDGSIDRFDLDTGQIKQRVFDGLGQVQSVALDPVNKKLYFAENTQETHRILTASSVDYTQDPGVVYDETPDFLPLGFSHTEDVLLDLVANRIYWSNRGGRISAADLDPETGEISNVQSLIELQTFENLGVLNGEGPREQEDVQFTGLTMLVFIVPDDADFNGDGMVDLHDFDILSFNYGEDSDMLQTGGDADGDGDVDEDDVNILVTQYGVVEAGEAVAATLPEPATAMVLLLALPSILTHRDRGPRQMIARRGASSRP